MKILTAGTSRTCQGLLFKLLLETFHGKLAEKSSNLFCQSGLPVFLDFSREIIRILLAMARLKISYPQVRVIINIKS